MHAAGESLGVTECWSGAVIGVDEVLVKGMTGDCMIDVAEVLAEDIAEEVDITATLVDERLVNICVVDVVTVLLEKVNDRIIEDAGLLKAVRVGPKEVMKVVKVVKFFGLGMTKGANDGQPAWKRTWKVSSQGMRLLLQVQIILVETVVNTIVS